MSSFVCVDASLILRTLVPGSFSDRAESLLARWRAEDIVMIGPSLLPYEVTSVLRRLVYLKAIPSAHGDEAFRTFLRLPIRLSYSRSIFSVAWQLAQDLARPRAYDSAYLAVAQRYDCPFWTADERLYNACRGHFAWVNWVGESTDIS